MRWIEAGVVVFIATACKPEVVAPTGVPDNNIDDTAETAVPTSTCTVAWSEPDETGIPTFTLSWSLLEPAGAPELTTTTGFFGTPTPGVTMSATFLTEVSDLTGTLQHPVPMVPVERTDGQDLQEHFRIDGALMAQVSVSAKWADGPECSSTLAVPFRTWGQIDETCTGDCLQPDDLTLPTLFDLVELSDDITASFADTVVSNLYFQSKIGADNYALAQLPLTGTPLQFTRVGQAVFDVWDTEHLSSPASVLDCDAWNQGSQLIITQGYPNLGQALSIVFDGDEQVQALSYTQIDEEKLPVEEQTWLHHNCFITPDTRRDDTAQIYTLGWSKEEGTGGGWSSNVVRLTVDLQDGSVVGEIDTIIPSARLTAVEYKYSNGLVLSPPGIDGVRWVGVSYANDNHAPQEKARAFFVAMPVTETEAGSPRFLFVNEAEFDPNTLTKGWSERFPELEIVDLPSDPLTGFYPIDFPHSLEFFRVESGVSMGGATVDVYRLIIASLGSHSSSNFIDGNAEVYMYTIFAPTDGKGATTAELFCGTPMPTGTVSHFDFVMPTGIDGEWVGAYSSNPGGELYWLDLWEVDANQRCRVMGAQRLSGPLPDAPMAAPIWSTEFDPVHLVGPEITDLAVRYDASVLSEAMVE